MTEVVQDLENDDTFVDVVWLNNKTEVINHLARMMEEGWDVTIDGLISESPEHGTIIARPLKVKGNNESTGVGIFKFNNRQ